MTLTTKPAEEAAKDHFSVSYKNLPSMCEVGDTIFLGRYLVTGADESSLFMEARPPLHPCSSPVPPLVHPCSWTYSSRTHSSHLIASRPSHTSVLCTKF